MKSKDTLLAKFNSIDHGSSYAEQDKQLILPNYLMDNEEYKDNKKTIKLKKRKLLQRPMSSVDNTSTSMKKKKELVSQFTFNMSAYNQAY